MSRAVDVRTHPDFTVEQIIEYTGFFVPSVTYKDNMRQALDFFQGTVPRNILRQQDDSGPWNLRINGTKIKLLNWMQGIDFSRPVNTQRWIGKGDPLIAYRAPQERPGVAWGSWYTFPSTQQESLAIPSSQTRLHKFKARAGFLCMLSTASDTFVGWVRGAPGEYRHGGARQLFIWNARQVLEPI